MLKTVTQINIFVETMDYLMKKVQKNSIYLKYFVTLYIHIIHTLLITASINFFK